MLFLDKNLFANCVFWERRFSKSQAAGSAELLGGQRLSRSESFGGQEAHVRKRFGDGAR